MPCFNDILALGSNLDRSFGFCSREQVKVFLVTLHILVLLYQLLPLSAPTSPTSQAGSNRLAPRETKLANAMTSAAERELWKSPFCGTRNSPNDLCPNKSGRCH